MDRLLYKEADGDITCRSRDFDKVFPTLYAYEELEMTPEEIEQTLLNFSSFLCEMTGGRMSKTNYTVQAMVSEANDYNESLCDECYDRKHLDEIEKKLEQVTKIRDDYAVAARTISLYLKEFCDESLPYPELIADASRKASAELEKVKKEQEKPPVTFADQVRRMDDEALAWQFATLFAGGMAGVMEGMGMKFNVAELLTMAYPRMMAELKGPAKEGS